MVRKSKQKQGLDLSDALIMVLQLGLNMIVPIIMCTVFAWFVGKRTNMPYMTIAGIVIGIMAGINAVYRQMKKYIKNEKSPGQLARERDEAEKVDVTKKV